MAIAHLVDMAILVLVIVMHLSIYLEVRYALFLFIYWFSNAYYIRNVKCIIFQSCL